MNHREQLVDTGLKQLRARDALAQASPAVEAALQREFRVYQRRRHLTSLAAWAAVAATIVLAIALSVHAPQPLASDGPSVAEARGPELATEFIPLQPLPADPDEFTQVIRVRLPRGELRRFGLAPLSQPLEGTIQADVVLGRDGTAQAVRFVH